MLRTLVLYTGHPTCPSRARKNDAFNINQMPNLKPTLQSRISPASAKQHAPSRMQFPSIERLERIVPSML